MSECIWCLIVSDKTPRILNSSTSPTAHYSTFEWTTPCTPFMPLIRETSQSKVLERGKCLKYGAADRAPLNLGGSIANEETICKCMPVGMLRVGKLRLWTVQ